MTVFFFIAALLFFTIVLFLSFFAVVISFLIFFTVLITIFKSVVVPDERFRLVLGRDELLNVAVLEELHLLRATDAASQWENAALSWILVRRWVGNSERAIDAVAVVERHVILIVCVVAALTHVMRAEAAVRSDAAAELALPVDLRGVVL